MAIAGICQPEFIEIDGTLRLRRFDGVFDFALSWYQDAQTLRLVDGNETPYDMERLERMYRWLDAHGELYFIELRRDGVFRPVGDVTFWQDDCPIVIGERSLRGQGIGLRVVRALVARGRSLGYDCLHVREIYDENIASQRLFERAGFTREEKTADGWRYRLKLQ